MQTGDSNFLRFVKEDSSMGFFLSHFQLLHVGFQACGISV